MARRNAKGEGSRPRPAAYSVFTNISKYALPFSATAAPTRDLPPAPDRGRERSRAKYEHLCVAGEHPQKRISIHRRYKVHGPGPNG